MKLRTSGRSPELVPSWSEGRPAEATVAAGVGREGVSGGWCPSPGVGVRALAHTEHNMRSENGASSKRYWIKANKAQTWHF